MKLKELRKNKGLSQRELAHILQVAPNTLSQWENGTRNPDPETLKQLADFFSVTIDYLLNRDISKLKLDEKKIPDAQAPGKNDMFSDEEYLLISNYRKLDSEDKAEVKGYINGKLADTKYRKVMSLPHSAG